jgi:hypothetical protein
MRKHKDETSDANAHKENSEKIKHEYKVNDQVLLIMHRQGTLHL